MTRQPEIRALENPVWVRWFVWGALACAVILALWAIALTVDRAQDVARFAAQGWPEQYAGVIVDNKIRSLWHAAFMTLCAGGALWFLVGQKSGVRSQESGARSQESGARSQESGARSQKSEADRGAKAEHRTLNPRSFVAWLLVFLVAADTWLLSRHYIKTMPMSALDENPVISLLKKDMPERRVALLTQEGFYNWWLTYLFPYHGIKSVNITQMPRMPTDYKNFLSAVGRNPLRLWELSAVGYVLAPAQVWPQIQRDPAWSNAFELVYSYNVAPADPQRIEAGFNVYPATAQYPGQHLVLRLIKPAPRFALIGKCRVAEDEEALRLLGSPSWRPFDEVLIGTMEETGGRHGLSRRSLPAKADGRPSRGDVPAPVHSGGSGSVPTVSSMESGQSGEDWGSLTNSGFVGSCKLEQYRAGRVELSVQARQSAILRVSEKYDKDWKAWVDGKPATVHRVDYIVQGVFVPAGSHHVLLRYAPSTWGLHVQLVGLAICLGAAVWLIVGVVRRRKS